MIAFACRPSIGHFKKSQYVRYITETAADILRASGSRACRPAARTSNQISGCAAFSLATSHLDPGVRDKSSSGN